MIINKFGRVVVPIGETFEYYGSVFRCEVFKKLSPTDNACDHCSLRALDDPCCALECCQDGRIDEQYVVFVKQEGGADDTH